MLHLFLFTPCLSDCTEQFSPSLLRKAIIFKVPTSFRVRPSRNDGGNLKTVSSFQEKIEENNGAVTRIRKAQSVRTYTNETINGKSFVPPPPKKRSYALVGGSIVVILVLIAATFAW